VGASTADFEDEVPDGWPPRGGKNVPKDIPIGPGDDEQPEDRHARSRTPKPAVIPTGFFEVTARDDKRRMLIRWTDVQTVLEALNPKDGTKIIVRGLGHLEADESYNAVLARMAETFQKATEEGRGW
jgi:trehalose-6-phosphatase